MSKKLVKTAKRALGLVFAFLLSIESFAAVVSDNDGSAFITKAEFEALKKDFNNQIDNYNSSIDRVKLLLINYNPDKLPYSSKKLP